MSTGTTDRRWLIATVISVFALFASAASAFYASRQSHIASDTAKRRLRPYITMFSGADAPHYTTIDVRKVGEKIRAETRFQNYGETPAYDVQVRLEVKTLDYPLPSGFDLVAQHINRQGLVGPHGDIFNQSYSETTLNDGDNTAVNKGDRAIYVYGRVDYDDSWHVPHWTDFCVWYSGRLSFVAANCDRHNDGDRD